MLLERWLGIKDTHARENDIEQPHARTDVCRAVVTLAFKSAAYVDCAGQAPTEREGAKVTTTATVTVCVTLAWLTITLV